MEVLAMKKMLVFFAVLTAATGAMAGSRMFQLSLTPDVAIYDKTEMIQGATFGLWSENPQRAFAFGMVNGSTGKSMGFNLGLINYCDDYIGAQFGAINSAKISLTGWQLGAINTAAGSVTGLQSGFVNQAGSLKMGLQLGIVNLAKKAEKGGQIGIVNVISENEKWFTGLPREVAPAIVLVNWRF